MSRTRTWAALCGLLLSLAAGCGKSQPAAGNQVAAAPTQVIQGTVTYHSQTLTSQPTGAVAPPASGVPSPTAGSQMNGPTVGAPVPGPSAGTAAAAPANGPSFGPAVSGPVVGAPNASAGQVPPPALPGQPMPAAGGENSFGTAPANQAAGPSSSGNVVPSGDLAALAAAANQWRLQGANLAGVKRLSDKPVLAGYSWMTQLLPYLGHNDLYGRFDFTKGWHDQVNIALTCEEIPAFLDPTDRNRHMAIVGEKKAIGPAFTHYVGMSGVEDTRNVVAAELPRSDPRAGIFGYDQVAANEQITDGTSDTIMLIGAGKIVGPWASGGGATVRGARDPYFDDITGFGSAGDPGSGALVAMADGSVKRISKDIDPAVFRALCTMHGAEKIDLQANANVIRPQ